MLKKGKTMKNTWLAAALVLVAACGGKSPTQPAPTTPALTIDQTTLVLARNATSRLHALFGVSGAQQDVTGSVAWTSSNPGIVTVKEGMLTAVGIGTATVTAAYQGQQRTIAVTARRRTALVGEIRLTNANGTETMTALRSYVDERQTGYNGSSHSQVSLLVFWEVGRTISDPTIDPGNHSVSVDVGQKNAPNAYVSDASSHVVIIDRDTREQLAVIQLPVQQKTIAGLDRMTWPVEVPVFSS